MKNISLCSIAFASLMALQGCGGGSSDSDNGATSGGPGGSDDTGSDDNGQGGGVVTMIAMQGDLKFDYSLREYGGTNFVYTTELASKKVTEFSEGEYVATNLFVGGLYGDDFYAPAIVSAGKKHIQLASRIDGKSTHIQIPNLALRETRIPCSVAATANATGSVAVIAVELSEPVEGRDYSCGDNPETWVYSYSNGNDTWWKADGYIDTQDIFHTSEGEIDFLVATNYVGNAASIYSTDGALLEDLSADPLAMGIRVIPLDAGATTRDDSYVAVVTEGTVRVTSRRLLVESGIASSTTLLSDISRASQVVTRVNKFNEQGIVLRSDSELYLIDSVQRDATKVADISALYAESWELDEVFVLGNHLFLVMEKYEGNSDTPVGKLVGVDLENVGAGAEEIVTSKTSIRAAWATGARFFNYTNDSNVQKSVVVRSDGTRSMSGEHSHYGSVINLEKGGKDVQTILLRAASGTDSGGLINPSVWTVNEYTGTPIESIGNITDECESVTGRYGVGSLMNIATMCGNQFAWRSLDTSTGEIRYISSNLRAIF